jgi:putative oxidoreductase
MTARHEHTAGRFLIAMLFVAGALQKATDPGAAQSLLAGFGLTPILVWPALGFNLCAAILLIGKIAVRPTSLALAAYCALTSIFHFIPADPWQMSIFVKNWAIAGGLLILASHRENLR